jgi:hypothetical protein
MMKTATEWKRLTQTERRVWNAWAKDNPVLLDDGNVRRVSGRKALTMVLRNRALAGEPANAATVPATTNWLQGALNVYDAGPFTVNAGYLGFRGAQNVATETKWLFWATPPVDGGIPDVLRQLRFIKAITLASITNDALTADMAPDYRAVHGSFDGPLADGEWPSEKFVWFRLHQYAGGQLGPGAVLTGLIEVEL